LRQGTADGSVIKAAFDRSANPSILTQARVSHTHQSWQYAPFPVVLSATPQRVAGV
jgi:hypothetical protein